MPVRVIFRGLILFQFPRTGDYAGKLVAVLVNNPEVTGGDSTPSGPPLEHGRHEHNHDADYQILTGRGEATELIPRALRADVNLDIILPPDSQGKKELSVARSFLRHVPDLDAVIERGTDDVRKSARVEPKRRLIRNIVTVDRGTVLVRDLVAWNEAEFPLSGSPADRGERPRSHALVKFMGSGVRGHMASEVIVEVGDANTVDVRLSTDPKPQHHAGADAPNPRVPPNTVEILVTNYEYQRGKPVPWSFDFQWLFELARYGAVELGGREFTAWEPFARRYDRALFDSDRALLLPGTTGLPFPYLESYDALTRLTPLTNELERPLCGSGWTSTTQIFK